MDRKRPDMPQPQTATCATTIRTKGDGSKIPEMDGTIRKGCSAEQVWTSHPWHNVRPTRIPKRGSKCNTNKDSSGQVGTWLRNRRKEIGHWQCSTDRDSTGQVGTWHWQCRTWLWNAVRQGVSSGQVGPACEACASGRGPGWANCRRSYTWF